MNEITTGETATVTNFVGASAPASQSAAARPQNITEPVKYPLSREIHGFTEDQGAKVASFHLLHHPEQQQPD